MGIKRNYKWVSVCMFIFLLVPVLFLEAAKSDKTIINEKLYKAGFKVGKVESVKGDYYKVQIKGIRPNHPLKFSGKFSPFTIPVKLWQGKVIINKSVLTKNKIRFNQNRLPGGLLIQEFKLPSLSPATAGIIMAEDPEIRKMNRALSTARRNRNLVPGKIAEIGEQVVLAKGAIDLCDDPPPRDPRQIQPSEPIMPRFGLVTASHDLAYRTGGIRSCDHYPDNTVTASYNSGKRYKYLRDILSEVIRIKNYATDRCRDGFLKESDRNFLKGTLDNLLRSAESQTVRFDNYVEDIERFKERYNSCKERNASGAIL